MIAVTNLSKGSLAHKRRAQKIASLLIKLLRREGVSVEIFIVSDALMRKNVLAYPAVSNFPRPDLKKQDLGEIYLNPKYIQEHGEDFDYMLIHGFLHLLGYDHIKKDDRIKMERKEKVLLRAIKKHLTEK